MTCRELGRRRLDKHEVAGVTGIGLEREIDFWLQHAKSVSESSLVFTRHFPKLYLNHKNAYKYVDLGKDGVDAGAQRKLVALLENKVYSPEKRTN